MNEQLTPPTSDAVTQPAADPSTEPYWARVGAAVRSITTAISKSLSPGDVADLRRLEPEAPSAPAFWKLAADVLDPKALLRPAVEEREDDERRWAAIITSIVLLGRFVQPGKRFGAALAGAEVAELRVVRLLRARGERLLVEVRRLAQLLAAKGEAIDPIDLAKLVLSEGGDQEDRVRRNIARDYYGHLRG